jgi:hypothetical protein
MLDVQAVPPGSPILLKDCLMDCNSEALLGKSLNDIDKDAHEAVAAVVVEAEFKEAVQSVLNSKETLAHSRLMEPVLELS